jgi:hypothetical protein
MQVCFGRAARVRMSLRFLGLAMAICILLYGRWGFKILSKSLLISRLWRP